MSIDKKPSEEQISIIRQAEEAKRRILGQPAEAEGVDFGFDDRSVRVSQEAYSIFLEREQYHLAALSAVTAERDRLRAELERAYANYNQVSYASTERGKQIDHLRAEVEALRAFVTDCTETAGGMVNGNRLSHRAKELIAAMAAKEA